MSASKRMRGSVGHINIPRLQNLPVKYIIDVESAVQGLGNNTDIFFNLMERFEETLLLESTKGIGAAMLSDNFCEMHKHA